MNERLTTQFLLKQIEQLKFQIQLKDELIHQKSFGP